MNKFNRGVFNKVNFELKVHKTFEWSSRIRVRLSGPLAFVCVSHTKLSTRRDGKKVSEVLYTSR